MSFTSLPCNTLSSNSTPIELKAYICLVLSELCFFPLFFQLLRIVWDLRVLLMSRKENDDAMKGWVCQVCRYIMANSTALIMFSSRSWAVCVVVGTFIFSSFVIFLVLIFFF